MKTIIGIIFIFVLLILSVFSCKIPESELIKNDQLPMECRVLLVLANQHQDSKDKAIEVPMSQACKEAMRFNRCEKYIKDRTYFAECKELAK